MRNSNEKKLENKDDEMDKEEEEYYNEFIKDLKVVTEKIKKNLKKHKKNEELIILIESGSLGSPHKMYIGLMEITKKYIEEKEKSKTVIGGYLIPDKKAY